ncbi:SDR family oxidoreductase [Pseudomonas sp. COR58]|uniref:SDR family oxidoreductase n=1 Tax=Pseudomonas ekonensis TaxID=2842353 RepID=A0ABS6PEY1_9PSED|nr:SDR family oxidoreductase [Pseudomonas ekonensis]MBV4458582.1 SDR family oxidoreductase [Pseudomonas ekonensis]
MKPLESSLRGQTVVVIGGSSGIGAAVASGAAARGACVYAVGRRTDAGGTGDVRQASADITDDASLRQLFERIGAFDHLVITAGPNVGAKPLADSDLLLAQQAFDVKFWGAVRSIQQALPYLSERGSITLTSGLLSRKFVAGQFVKTTLNAALEALAKQLAKELAPRRVNVVSPGVTDTEAYAGMDESQRAAMFARTSAALPVGRIGTPQDLAAAFMLAMENGFISGSIIDVDGGGLL